MKYLKNITLTNILNNLNEDDKEQLYKKALNELYSVEHDEQVPFIIYNDYLGESLHNEMIKELYDMDKNIIENGLTIDNIDQALTIATKQWTRIFFNPDMENYKIARALLQLPQPLLDRVLQDYEIIYVNLNDYVCIVIDESQHEDWSDPRRYIITPMKPITSKSCNLKFNQVKDEKHIYNLKRRKAYL